MKRACVLLAIALTAQTQSQFERGNELLAAGRVAEAEAAYRAHLKTHPGDVNALVNLGAALSRAERFGEAIQIYQRALTLAPRLAPLQLNLGLAYFKSRQWTQAAGAFDRFLTANPGHKQAMQLRALALLEMESFEKAAAAFEALLPTSDPTILLGLASAYVKSGRGAEGQKVLGPLLEQGTSPEILLTLGQAYFAGGQDDEAMAAFQRARSLNPNLATLGLHIGAVHWRKRRLQEALAEWRAEAQKFPGSAEAQFTLGAATLLTGGEAQEAEALLRKAIALKPTHARANFQLAKLIWQQRKSPQAIACLQQAVKSDPELREAFYLLGRIYQETGRKAEADRAFARVKAISEKELSRQSDLFSEPQ